ncbi:MAG TPA: hypothetical protein VGP88_09480 [Thermoplasmata archaeon]|nr:hypothetical protein [Thermoplasmata archaeon]
MTQLTANFRTLRVALLGLGAFVLVYGCVALGYWLQFAWQLDGYVFETLLQVIALFEVAFVGIAFAAAVILYRRQGELDQALVDGSDPSPSPLERAELHSYILRSLSRQVDSLLLWLPFAIVVSVLAGLVLLASQPFGPESSSPLVSTASFVVALLGVPVAVTVFGVGSLLAIRSTTRRQHELSESGWAWWDPSIEAPPRDGEADSGAGGPTPPVPVPGSGAAQRMIAEAGRRARRERRVVLRTALAALAGLAGLAAVIGVELDCSSLGATCPSGTGASLVIGIGVGIVALGFLPPAYIAMAAARREPGTRPPTGLASPPGHPSSVRVSDEIAMVAQVETLQNRLREEARDSLWLTWFTAIWILVAGALAVPSFGDITYSLRALGEPAMPVGALLAIVVGQVLLVLLPMPLAAVATLTWFGRRRADARSRQTYRALVRGYALLEQGFWERF